MRDPEHLFNLDILKGMGLVTLSTIGAIYVVANDLIGVGTVDDFLLGSLVAGVEEGMILIFR